MVRCAPMAGPSTSSTTPGHRTRTNVFLVVFLLVQLVLPLRGFFTDKYESRGNFSWNMYASKYSCRAAYTLVRGDGRRVEIDLHEKFRLPSHLGKVAHLDVLPSFHAWLCDDLERRGARGRLFGSVHCRLNDDPPRRMVAETVNLCGAENYGVPDR